MCVNKNLLRSNFEGRFIVNTEYIYNIKIYTQLHIVLIFRALAKTGVKSNVFKT